ncbi:hypothetical protein CAPTEDRAFT_186441 [Capitella teleta]|uniref:Uncharacterized protein n=1 Tax=Capitella teleta TaxID=283909 RepID=R7VDD8_CAPTE|nr:hypothetical protein CAPTEDRAFT_186441 [Capitella teleta]|eukprot:ELU16858.1 hypothetical protein CAPTEDRAFT_186441 [Capitella teleta]
MSGDGGQSLVGFDGDQEHSLINKSDMQSAINILIPPIPPCTPSRTNEPHTDDEDSDYEDIYVDEVDSQVEEVPDSSMSKGKRPGKKLNKSSFPMATAKFQKRTLHLLVEIRSLLQRAVSQPGELVERGQQNSLYYAEKQFTHIHEFPDLNTEDKQLWVLSLNTNMRDRTTENTITAHFRS